MPDEMIIFTRTYDFLSWIIPLSMKFPRSHRFIVTGRLQNAALDFQELIIEANAAQGRKRAEKLGLPIPSCLKSGFICASANAGTGSAAVSTGMPPKW